MRHDCEVRDQEAPLAGFDAPAKARKFSISGRLDGSAQVAVIGF